MSTTQQPARRRTIHLAAHFPGVNNTTVWSDPASGSHIDFSSFVHLALTAEAAKFDFFFLAEGLRLREQNGQIYDLDVVGRPDTFAILAALSAVTERIGLAGTINSTFNEPYEVARQFASLDHLSAGRAAWNVVTSHDAFTGENFRRGGYLRKEQRYQRAGEFVATARELLDSWAPGDLASSHDAPVWSDPSAGQFSHDGEQFTIAGRFGVPRSPQGHPVIFQAGDSDEGREFAARDADVIFTRHGTLAAGQEFYADVKARLAKYGKGEDDLLVLPGATFIIGDSQAQAEERAVEVRRQQVSGQTALRFAEQIWNTDLSSLDPDGPLPDFDPVEQETTTVQGRAAALRHGDRKAKADRLREQASAQGWSLREVFIEETSRQNFIGTPEQIADQIDEYVQTRASDGFILVPHLTPGGLDEFAAKVVPVLQERGLFRNDYEGTTLREHLGLRHPDAAATGGQHEQVA